MYITNNEITTVLYIEFLSKDIVELISRISVYTQLEESKIELCGDYF